MSSSEREHEIALMEGHLIPAADDYFKARHEMLDTLDPRRIYEAAYKRAWDDARRAQASAEPFTDAVVREKARIHAQDGRSHRSYWNDSVEMVAQVLEHGFKAGFRSAERAHGITAAKTAIAAGTNGEAP